jgi:hypothetical protein
MPKQLADYLGHDLVVEEGRSARWLSPRLWILADNAYAQPGVKEQGEKILERRATVQEPSAM